MDAETPDQELVRILALGEETHARAAFDHLLARHGARWRATSNRYAGGLQGGEEVFQDAMMKLWQNRGNTPLTAGDEWLGWVHKRIWFSGKEFRRRNNRPADAAVSFDETEMLKAGKTPLDVAMARELRRHLDGCLAALKGSENGGLSEREIKQVIVLFALGTALTKVIQIIGSGLDYQHSYRELQGALKKLKYCLIKKGHGRS